MNFWKSRWWKAGRLLVTAVAIYMAYTGATGRELVWEVGPGIIGDATEYLAEVSVSNAGRWALVAIGVGVLVAAWVPAALRNLAALRDARPGQTRWRDRVSEMTPGQRAHLEDAERRRDEYLRRGLKRHAREVNKQMRLARDHWWGDDAGAPRRDQSPASAAPPGLKGPHRDDLRRLIKAFDSLDRGNEAAVEEWARTAAEWLEAHGLERDARSFRNAAPDRSEQVKALRIALLQQVPQGITIDLTPIEAVDRWMEIEGIPEAERHALRECTDAYVQHIDAEPTKSLEIARELLGESDELEKEIWETRLRLKRSAVPLPMLPKALLQRIEAWNKRVVALADANLSVKEAGDVDSYPYILAGLVGAERMIGLLNNNRVALRIILRRTP